MSIFSKKFSGLSYNRGMTLVELLVVLAIFVIVSSLIMFDYGGYKSSISLENLANDIALSIRKAQSYAIGVAGSGASFTYAYGVHISTAQEPVTAPQYGSNKSFFAFTDVSGDRMYEQDGDSDAVCSVGGVTQYNECSEKLSITSDDQIEAIYLNGDTNPVVTGGGIDIVFLRPNPDAYFCYRSDPSHTTCDAPINISNVKIKISNIRSKTVKYVTVWTTGQISTQ
jgi:prepilin-type N-terminal cleavage/methylation domain-containing protein